MTYGSVGGCFNGLVQVQQAGQVNVELGQVKVSRCRLLAGHVRRLLGITQSLRQCVLFCLHLVQLALQLLDFVEVDLTEQVTPSEACVTTAVAVFVVVALGRRRVGLGVLVVTLEETCLQFLQ